MKSRDWKQFDRHRFSSQNRLPRKKEIRQKSEKNEGNERKLKSSDISKCGNYPENYQKTIIKKDARFRRGCPDIKKKLHKINIIFDHLEHCLTH